MLRCSKSYAAASKKKRTSYLGRPQRHDGFGAFMCKHVAVPIPKDMGNRQTSPQGQAGQRAQIGKTLHVVRHRKTTAKPIDG